MARRTMVINGLSDRVTVRALPVERAEEAISPGTMDAVICNPPYALPGAASVSANPARALARQQTGNGLPPGFGRRTGSCAAGEGCPWYIPRRSCFPR